MRHYNRRSEMEPGGWADMVVFIAVVILISIFLSGTLMK